MLLSSKQKIIKSAGLRSKPVEINLRNDFEHQKGDVTDPQIRRQLEQVQAKAEKILQQARQEAEAVLQEAQNRRAEYLEQGRQEGLEIGFKQGLEAGEKQGLILKEQAHQTLEEARQAYQNLLEEAEPKLIDLSLLIAEKVIHKQILVEPETVVAVAKAVLEETRAGETYLIYANPQDLEFLRNGQKELQKVIPEGAGLLILADKNISLGGCRLETDDGYFDATLDEQLNELKKLFAGGGIHV